MSPFLLLFTIFEINTYKVPQYEFEYVEGRLGLREFNNYFIFITFNYSIFKERIMLITIYLIEKNKELSYRKNLISLSYLITTPPVTYRFYSDLLVSESTQTNAFCFNHKRSR